MNRSLLTIVFLCVLACTPKASEEKEYPNPPLGEFMSLGGDIDKSRNNKYDDSLFMREWVFSSAIMEEYKDGELKNVEDVTEIVGTKGISFYHDYTLSLTTSNNTEIWGKWLYTHNYILYSTQYCYYVWEVVSVGPYHLILKEEIHPAGISYRPFFKDPSQPCDFLIYDYVTK